MANSKISEYSSIPANNTEIDGINIAEGCAPSGINNAIRELMAQLKDFQSGTAGDSLTVGGNLSVTGAVNLTDVLTVTNGGTGLSTVTAGDMLYASASNTLARLSGAGATGSVLLSGTTAPSWGKLPLTTHVTGTLPVANGGTGSSTATGAINALLPSQTGNNGKVLQTDGSNVSWATVTSGGTSGVTSITAGSGLTGGTITSSGTISMGTPGTLSASSTNTASGSTHTHAVTFPVTSLKGQSSDTAQTGDIILTNLASFAKSHGANGYQTLPGGLIVQWGYKSGSGAQTVAFNSAPNIAFTTACYSFTVTQTATVGNSPLGSASTVTALSATSATVYTAPSATGFYWIAIGV
jgi:hypothetical protein